VGNRGESLLKCPTPKDVNVRKKLASEKRKLDCVSCHMSRNNRRENKDLWGLSAYVVGDFLMTMPRSNYRRWGKKKVQAPVGPL